MADYQQRERMNCLVQGSRRYPPIQGCIRSFPLPSPDSREEQLEGREMLSLLHGSFAQGTKCLYNGRSQGGRSSCCSSLSIIFNASKMSLHLKFFFPFFSSELSWVPEVTQKPLECSEWPLLQVQPISGLCTLGLFRHWPSWIVNICNQSIF